MSKDNDNYQDSIYFLWYGQSNKNNDVVYDHYKKSIESRKEMSKMFGNFLISITEKCFDCIDLSYKNSSRYERNCLKDCVNGQFNNNEEIIKILLKNIEKDKINVDIEKSYYDLNMNELKDDLNKINIFKDF